jgi:hypothetical protein
MYISFRIESLFMLRPVAYYDLLFSAAAPDNDVCDAIKDYSC